LNAGECKTHKQTNAKANRQLPQEL